MKLIATSILSFLLFTSCHTEEVNITDANIDVYPNPFYYSFYLDVGVTKTSTIEVSIYGEFDELEEYEIRPSDLVAGQNPIISESLNPLNHKNFLINAGNWKSGTYYMDVTIGGKTERINLIKE